jgi:pimeloyl-ACP methyl ester carboxylesterase
LNEIQYFIDNAGTFDRLIPLLPDNLSFLCVDMPGTGLSSKLPPGASYYALDNLYFVDLIREKFKIDNVSLMGHSFGSIISFLYSTIFPNKVNMVIGIDALKSLVFDPDVEIIILEELAKNRIKADKEMNDESSGPAYTEHELYQKLNESLEQITGGGITKEAARCLLPRNTRESKNHPGKFEFTKDSRDRWSFVTFLQQGVSVQLAERLNMPYLFIKARHSPYYDGKENFDQVIESMKKNPKFELEFVDGTHHVHLNDPEKVAPSISRFLEKHWKPLPFQLK